MRKKKIKSLSLSKSIVSNLSTENIKGGLSGACTSSVRPHDCRLACPESVYVACH